MTSPFQFSHRLALCLAVVAAMTVFACSGQAEVPDAEQLAQRFRPYYKFSMEGNSQEPCRPCSWQWFAAHSDLFLGQNRIATFDQLRKDPSLILSLPYGNILRTKNPTGPLKLIPTEGTAAGEPWPDVINTGAGLYAQVEDAGDNFVILTYWSLFAFNQTTAIEALGGGNHTGDIIAVVLVYDRTRDQLVRASYGMHGRIIESFDLTGATFAGERELSGCRVDGSTECVKAKAFCIAPDRRYENGPYYYSPSDPAELYMVQDPKSKQFEHLAVYCEWGSHEPWPNPYGSVWLTPSHNGMGISFLPVAVRFLGAFNHPAQAEAPFVYFNGYWGKVPKGIIFHRSCFYPEGRKRNHFKIPGNSFVDRDPFGNGTLPWPPLRERNTGKPTENVGTN
jgi:hypothetical protein